MDILAKLQAQVEALASRWGWDWGDGLGYQRWTQSGSSVSRYAVLSRESGNDSEGWEYQTLKVRVSDHPSVYCSEDFSICPEPGADDHTLSDLEKVLAAPFTPD